MVTSENASLSATSFVHWKHRVNWRVNLKTATGTVVTLASCPANLSHKVITWGGKKKRWSTNSKHNSQKHHLQYLASQTKWIAQQFERQQWVSDNDLMIYEDRWSKLFWTYYVINFLQIDSVQFITSWVVQARGPAKVMSFLLAFSFRIAINVSRATSYLTRMCQRKAEAEVQKEIGDPIFKWTRKKI